MMKYVFLIAAFNSFFFSALLVQKKPKALPDKILFFWLLYLGLFTSLYTFSTHEFLARINNLSSFIVSLFLLHGPFLYLYVESFTPGKNRPALRDLLHFVPFISFFLYLIISLLFPEYSGRLRMDHVDRDVNPSAVFVIFLLVTAISGPVYFYVSLRKVRNISKNILNHYSTTEEINLNWLKSLIFIFGIIWSALVSIAMIHHIFHYFSMVFCTDGLFLSLSFFIILVGYFGLRQKEIFTRFSMDNQVPAYDQRVKYQNIPINEYEIQEYMERIRTIMELKKPHLDPDLTLPALATITGLPSYQLSRVINEKFGCNFFDFINGYRVDEVKTRLTDPAFNNFSLLGIAFECGFNSKSAFNRIFKKLTGLTPSEYKKSVS